MVKLTFLPVNQTVEFEVKTLPYAGHGKRGSLLDAALNFGIPLAHVCGGHAACTTCHVLVRKGEELLSEMEDQEQNRLELAAGVTLHSRLACQAMIAREGEMIVEIPLWPRDNTGMREG